ncbi:MAG: hypothetical protein A2787_01725, partial [Omnitrophica WOR_2 bacterium RIFCSPHIGHO2_01_FULL_48_9]
MDSKVSIILYVCNGEKHLKDAIESCLKQTYANIELVIVNDASRDQTSEVIRQYHDARVKCINNIKNLGKAFSWNKGINESSGDYLVPITYAERLSENAVEELLRTLQANKGGQFVYSDFYVHHLNSQRKEEINLPTYENILNMYRISPCFMFSKKVYSSIGEFNNRFIPAQTYAFWVRAIEKFSLIHCRKPLGTTLAFPGKVEFNDLVQISLMEDVVRYCKGHGQLARIIPPTESFLRQLWWSKKGLLFTLQISLQVFIKLCRLSLEIGLYFGSALCVSGIKGVFRPFFRFFKKLYFQIKLNEAKARIAKGDSKIDVLCLIPELVVGGSEKVTGDIVKGLSDQGYRFHLLGSRGEYNRWCENLLKLFESTYLLSPKLRDPDNANMDEYYFYLRQVGRTLKIKIVLISNSAQGYKATNRLKTDFPDIKILDLLHVEKFGGTTDEVIPYLPSLDRRVCISYYLKDHVLGKYKAADINGRFSQRLNVIYNGNDMNDFDPLKVAKGVFRSRYGIQQDTKLISYIGRVSYEKRPLLVVDIAKNIFESNPNLDCRFVIAGNGPEYGCLKEKIKICRLEKKFILT